VAIVSVAPDGAITVSDGVLEQQFGKKLNLSN